MRRNELDAVVIVPAGLDTTLRAGGTVTIPLLASAAAALITVWALVGTGAIGIAAGMLGGAMWPLEIVPYAMRTIGHITPHAWAVDGWTEILSRGGIPQIATHLAVLGTFALALLTIASVRLGRRLTA